MSCGVWGYQCQYLDLGIGGLDKHASLVSELQETEASIWGSESLLHPKTERFERVRGWVCVTMATVCVSSRYSNAYRSTTQYENVKTRIQHMVDYFLSCLIISLRYLLARPLPVHRLSKSQADFLVRDCPLVAMGTASDAEMPCGRKMQFFLCSVVFLIHNYPPIYNARADTKHPDPRPAPTRRDWHVQHALSRRPVLTS